MNDMSSPPTPLDPDAHLNAMLTAQAHTLDALFADLIGHAASNMTEWPAAAEAYARLAFRAQWNCRASLEAIARLRRSEALASLSDAKADRLVAPRQEGDAR